MLSNSSSLPFCVLVCRASGPKSRDSVLGCLAIARLAERLWCLVHGPVGVGCIEVQVGASSLVGAGLLVASIPELKQGEKYRDKVRKPLCELPWSPLRG